MFTLLEIDFIAKLYNDKYGMPPTQEFWKILSKCNEEQIDLVISTIQP
jgi:hypothetical protein